MTEQPQKPVPKPVPKPPLPKPGPKPGPKPVQTLPVPKQPASVVEAPEEKKMILVTVEWAGKTYTEDLMQQSFIDTDLAGLNQALAEHPGRLAWWGSLEVAAKRAAEELEDKIKVKEAELFNTFQSELTVVDESGKEKRPTLDAIKAAVVTSDERKKLSQEILDARSAFEQIRVGRQTMQDRKDCLLAIASNMRAEWDATMYLKQHKYEQEHKPKGVS